MTSLEKPAKQDAGSSTGNCNCGLQVSSSSETKRAGTMAVLFKSAAVSAIIASILGSGAPAISNSTPDSLTRGLKIPSHTKGYQRLYFLSAKPALHYLTLKAINQSINQSHLQTSKRTETFFGWRPETGLDPTHCK